MTAQQQREKSQRKDKTGSRTWAGMPAGMRRQTTFDLTSYMRDWPDPTVLPPHGPLFEAAMGGAGVCGREARRGRAARASTINFVAPHGSDARAGDHLRRRDPVRGGGGGSLTRWF